MKKFTIKKTLLNKEIQLYKVQKRTMMLLRSNIYKNFIKTSLLSKNYNFISIKIQRHENRLLISENKKTEHVFDFMTFVENYNKNSQKVVHVSQTLLLTTDQNKKYISGLMSISPKEYILLRAQDMDSKNYQAVVKFTLAKILYVLYGMDQKICLKQKFELIFSTTGLDLNNMPKLLSLKKYTTLLQSILSYVCHDTSLTFEMLKDFAFPLDCESYRGKHITILAFIEAFIVNKNLHRNSIDRTDTKFYLVNPENLQAVPGFSNMESMVQTNQRNSDLYIRTIFNKQILDTYMDVKTFSVAGFFDRNLLSAGFINQKEFLKLFNNIIITLQMSLKTITDVNLKINLQDLIDKLREIKLSDEDFLVKARFMHDLLLKFKFNPENVLINVSLNVALNNSQGVSYDTMNNILENLMSRIEQNRTQNLEIMFPSNSQINLEQRSLFLEAFVRDVSNDDLLLLETMISNMRASFLITNT